MWASSKVATVALTAVCAVALAAIGGRTGSTIATWGALLLPFAVWAWHLRSKR